MPTFQLFFRAWLVAATLALVLSGTSVSQEIEQNDASALNRLRLAAEQGDSSAQYELGVKYYTGKGMPENHSQAFEWFRLSAEQGNISAQVNLSTMYDKGDGVARNHPKAIKWLRLAAEQGSASAQFYLGGMYANDEELVQAHKWYKLAAAQGHQQAPTFIGYLEEQMTNSQLVEVHAHKEVYCNGFSAGWVIVEGYSEQPACPDVPKLTSDQTWYGRGVQDGIRSACWPSSPDEC